MKKLKEIMLNDEQLKIVRRNLSGGDPTMTRLSRLKHIKVFHTTVQQLKPFLNEGRKTITDQNGNEITTVINDFSQYWKYNYSVYYREIKTGALIASVGTRVYSNSRSARLILVQDYPFSDEFLGEKEFLDNVSYSKVEDIYAFLDEDGVLSNDFFYYDDKKGKIYANITAMILDRYLVSLFKPTNNKEAHQSFTIDGVCDKLEIYYTSDKFALVLEKLKRIIVTCVEQVKISNLRYVWKSIDNNILPEKEYKALQDKIVFNLSGNAGYKEHLSNNLVKKLLNVLLQSKYLKHMPIEYMTIFYSEIYCELIERFVRNNQNNQMISIKPIITNNTDVNHTDEDTWVDKGKYCTILPFTDDYEVLTLDVLEEYTPTSMKDGETILLKGKEFNQYKYSVESQNVFPLNAFSVEINEKQYKLSELWWKGDKTLKSIKSGKGIFRLQRIFSPRPKTAYLYRRVPLEEPDENYPWILSMSGYYNIMNDEDRLALANWAKELDPTLTPGVQNPYEYYNPVNWVDLVNY